MITSAYLNRAYYGVEGFDVVLADGNIYGVFDGMGTDGESLAIARKLHDEFARFNGHNFEDLQEVLRGVISDVKTPFGGSTATIAFLDMSNNLHYAHVGDSRLYVINRKRLKQVTADEGYGNILSNYVGAHGSGVFQYGVIERDDWQRAMLCTDGITGDWPDQFIDEVILEKTLRARRKPHQIAGDIMGLSKKNDDRSVIVIFKEEQ
jgi:serine/threonine protein phosphatase PrpC